MNKKAIKTLAKVAISGLLLYLVFTKIEFKQVIELIKSSNPYYGTLAVILFVVSQLVSSFRLNYIFHQNNFLLTHKSNLKLYFVGMFYNFFIPGGVGGDAYKVYLLSKKFNWKVKTITQAVLIDRVIGLVAIVCLLFLMAGSLFFKSTFYLVLGLIGSILTFFISKIFLKFIYKDISKIFTISFWLSFFIQLLQLGSIWAIIKTFQLEVLNAISYFFVFLTSSVLSVVSFAGFGAREFVFLKASTFLETQESIATSIGLSFNLITALISLFGAIFIITKLSLKAEKAN